MQAIVILDLHMFSDWKCLVETFAHVIPVGDGPVQAIALFKIHLLIKSHESSVDMGPEKIYLLDS